MSDENMITEKILEVEEELRKVGLWKTTIPKWVNEYEALTIKTEQDFTEWLQFVFLPNKMQQVKTRKVGIQKHYITPQARRFFGEDIKKGRLLQLLVELDSML